MSRWKLLVVVTALALGSVTIAVPGWRSTTDRGDTAPDAARETAVAMGSPSEGLLDRVYARFDPRHPGRGVTDYPGNTVEDIPKSYAMILLAELERRRLHLRGDLPDLARTAGRWLLHHATRSADRSVGWGVPVAWDAYGDGSENPADTVYSISTAIAVDALITWMEQSPRAPRRAISQTVSEALDTFGRAPRTPDHLMPYSLEQADRPYDTFNPAAYLAGQMQRFSRITSDRRLAKRLTRAADATVDSLVRNHRVSATGSWYWWYSVQEHRANDMPHAGYIIDGLRTYVRSGGRLSGRVDTRAVTRHLRDFVAADGSMRAWPDFQRDIDRPPRLYDLGIALHLSCTEPGLQALSRRLRATVPSYESPAGFLRFPRGTPDQPELVVNEYEAYLWRGLVSCAATTRDHTGRLRASKPGAGPGLVPFVRVGRGVHQAPVSFVSGRSSLTLPWSPGKRVRERGVVLQAVDDGAGGVLVTRGFPRNDLSLVALGKSGTQVSSLPIVVSSGSAPILRATGFHDGLLYLVYYDNPTLLNYLARFQRTAQGYAPVGEPDPLPSLEDPSGGTYEMIPAVFLLGSQNGLHVVGGTLDGLVAGDGSVAASRLENCSRVVEAVATVEGPVVLCIQRDERSPSAPFELLGPPGVDLPDLGRHEGVPFGLRVSGGRVGLRFASSPRSYARMLRFDLRRTNAGWLEFGTDNVEGRIPWSQIYYLNGFLDFLLLSRDTPRRWNAFEPVLRGMQRRLDQEVPIALHHFLRGRYETRAFTVDRSLALFAVQTSRLLLVSSRYREELHDSRALPGFRRLRADVSELRDHIEVLTRGDQDPSWWPARTPYLEWPKGSAFSFDGLNVPYNHQNEWSYALVRAGNGAAAAATGRAIVSQFVHNVAPAGRLPSSGTWDYWWGQAYDGWSADDQVSVHRPAYAGDHIKAAISFRSIDAMSALAAAPLLKGSVRRHLRTSAADLVRRGHLYPFVSYELRRAGEDVTLPDRIARRYLRVSSPWELQNAAWAYAAELNRLRARTR